MSKQKQVATQTNPLAEVWEKIRGGKVAGLTVNERDTHTNELMSVTLYLEGASPVTFRVGSDSRDGYDYEYYLVVSTSEHKERYGDAQ